jgi:hypothetical protein
MYLDLGAPADLTPNNPTPSAPVGFDQRMEIDAEAWKRLPSFVSREQNNFEEYRRAADRIAAITGAPPANPYAPLPYGARLPPQDGRPAEAATRATMLTRWDEQVARARQQHPEFVGDLPFSLDVENRAGEKARAAALEAQRAGLVTAPYGWAASAIGSVGGMLTDPVQLLALPFGAGRLAGSLALRVLKGALIEGGAQAGAQAIAETRAAPYRAEIGAPGDAGENILGAFAGGALLGGGGRALAAAARGVLDRLGPVTRQAAEDALAVADRQNLAPPSPFAPGGEAIHLRALDEAMAATREGRPFSLADTLRGSTADAELLGRPRPIAVDIARETAGVPVEEFSARITAAARAAAPALFERLDAVAARMDELRGTRAANMAPEDVALRLNQIERDLANPDIGPRRIERLQRQRQELLAPTEWPALAKEREALQRQADVLIERAATKTPAEPRERIVARAWSIAQTSEPHLKAIGGAIEDAAFGFDKLTRAIDAGGPPLTMEPMPLLQKAIDTIRAARAAGETIGVDRTAWLSDAERGFVAMLFKDAALTEPASRAQIANRLRGYAAEAAKGAAAVDEAAPGIGSNRPAMLQAAREAKAPSETVPAPELDQARLGDARRVAAATDPAVALDDGTSHKASELLDAAAEQKRVAKEIADACLLAGAPLP